MRGANGQYGKKPGRLKMMAGLKTMMILLCLVMTFAALTGCAKQQRPQGYRYVIGLSLPTIREPWLRQMTEDMLGALPAEEANLITKDAAGSVEKQREDIGRLINSGIDVLIVVPQNMSELEETLRAAYQKIPVIVVGVAPAGSDYSSCIRFDDEAIGRLLGEQLLTDYQQGDPVVILTGPETSAISRARLAGLHAALAGRVQEQDITFANGEWLRDKAENRMKDYLVGHHAPTKVFAFNDEMAYGAYMAAEQFRIEGITFFGVDGQEGRFGGRQLVADGYLQATICLPSIGRVAMDTAMALLNGKEVESMQVLPGEMLHRE